MTDLLDKLSSGLLQKLRFENYLIFNVFHKILDK